MVRHLKLHFFNIKGWAPKDSPIIYRLFKSDCKVPQSDRLEITRDAICGLSLFLVLPLAPRGFSPGTPVFASPQKPTFANSNSTRNQVDEEPLCGCTTCKSLFIYLFIYLFILREHLATSAQRAKVVLLLTTSGRSLMPIVGRGRDKQAVLWDTRNHLRPRGEYAIDMYTFDTRAHAVYIRLV